MTSLPDNTESLLSNEAVPLCVEQPASCSCANNTASVTTWHQPAQADINCCTPESFPLSRCAATRRLHYTEVPNPTLLFFDTTQLDPSDDLQSTTLTPWNVTGEVQFSDDQVDCICDVLRQSSDVERLQSFLSSLTRDQLQRESERLYKVHTYTYTVS